VNHWLQTAEFWDKQGGSEAAELEATAEAGVALATSARERAALARLVFAALEPPRGLSPCALRSVTRPASRNALFCGSLLVPGLRSLSRMPVGEIRTHLECLRGSTKRGCKASSRRPHAAPDLVSSHGFRRSVAGVHTRPHTPPPTAATAGERPRQDSNLRQPD
jgi:hypothetical protein